MPQVISARRHPKGHERLFVRYLPTRTVDGRDASRSSALMYEIHTRPTIPAKPGGPEPEWTLIGWACGHTTATGTRPRKWIGVDTRGTWTRWRSSRTEIAEDIADLAQLAAAHDNR